MPVGDWQFWIVTLVALVGAGLVFRAVRPRRTPRPKKTDLTIEGRKR